jgi:hypothetical protein
VVVVVDGGAVVPAGRSRAAGAALPAACHHLLCFRVLLQCFGFLELNLLIISPRTDGWLMIIQSQPFHYTFIQSSLQFIVYRLRCSRLVVAYTDD